MRKVIFLFALLTALSGFSFAKSALPEFAKVRQIRLLYDNRTTVRRILADYRSDSSQTEAEEISEAAARALSEEIHGSLTNGFSADEEFSEEFSTENVEIEVYYSKGKCSVDEVWKVDKWKVTKIKITLENNIKLKNFKFDFSNYVKAADDKDESDDYNYYDENTGINFSIEDGEIQTITLFPSKSNDSLLCKNEDTEDFFAGDENFVELNLKEVICRLPNPVPDVTDLILDATQINADWTDGENEQVCAVGFTEIRVKTLAEDPDNDPLTHQYTVSGGKIIGQGAEVVWDLSGLKPGTYTITAAVDDGCGFCGKEVTKQITVKECPKITPK